MAIEIDGKVYRNLQQQVQKNMDDIEELKETGGTAYTAGDGIDITENVISVDTDTVAMKSDIPDAVSGTNDGTNWTSLTVGNDTYAIPSGGGSQSYQHNVVYKGLDSNSKIVTYFTAQFVSTSSTVISSKARLIAYLDGAGFVSENTSIDEPYLPVNGSTLTTINNNVPGRVYGIYYNSSEDEIYLISDYGDLGSNQYINVDSNADNYSTVSIKDKVIPL